ncbi:MAG: ABC transporter ATP-binding protein, partial [Myxococcales bacterium]|nr:ABC transporter ATP-binding protein [Myxococcales bacterium]
SIDTMSPWDRAKIVVLLQQTSPFQPYCLTQHRIAHGLVPIHGFSWLNDECIAQIYSQAKKLNIFHLLNRKLNAISGGEHRLIDIAKVLINQEAKLILLDEPSVFLDFSQKKILTNNIIERSKSAVTIFSSHDLDFIENTATEIILIENACATLMSVAQFRSSFNARSSKSSIARSGLTPP